MRKEYQKPAQIVVPLCTERLLAESDPDEAYRVNGYRSSRNMTVGDDEE